MLIRHETPQSLDGVQVLIKADAETSVNIEEEEETALRLTFLGKESKPNESPTLYSSDEDTYIVQGWIVTDREILEKLEIQKGETVVEVPPGLFAHLAKDGVSGTVTRWTAPIVYVTAEQNFIVLGVRVTSEEARSQMDIPDHEDCVEIPKAALRALLSEG
ncbi:hypothetical protein [Acrocarpospora sp. B8E8]|uniref:hypothetical protein n=1 Tax=Acrocarpospora sp. B8E8 TaxID=3153572 RepID=UPI00325F7DD1